MQSFDNIFFIGAAILVLIKAYRAEMLRISSELNIKNFESLDFYFSGKLESDK